MPPLRLQALLVFVAWLTWQAQALPEDLDEEEEEAAVVRWHEKRKTLPADWEQQNALRVSQEFGSQLQGRRLQFGPGGPSMECQKYPAANVSQCCGRLQEEVTDECLSYKSLGFTDITCRSWRQEMRLGCPRYCGECNATGEIVFEICKFTLQIVGNGALIRHWCTMTQKDFIAYRCPTACHVPKGICRDKAAPTCMAECGNYYPCHCRYRRNTLFPEECLGTPVNHGPVPNQTFRNFSCGMTPEKCMHFKKEGNKCAKHRWCTPDLCIINKVECSPPDQCLDGGFCKRDEGKCFYNNRPYGYKCNDGLFYTVRDICVKGNCVGEADYCLKYNVSCAPFSACLKGGVCQPQNGRCIYSKLDEGSFCDDGRDYTVEDRCVQGFCLGRAVDLCMETGIKCRSSNECMLPGTCDPRTAKCSLPIPLSNRTCEDGDATTNNDTCIDGLCIGVPGGTSFQTLGAGECSDRNNLRMGRYIGDTQTEQECEQVCLADAQCRAYNYAYPSCSLWGTVRFQAPEDRQWAFIGGSVPLSAVSIEKASKVAPGQRSGVCRLKAEKSNEVMEMPGAKIEVGDLFNMRVMSFFFMTMLICFCILPLFRCVRVCCSRMRRPKTMGEDDSLPEGYDDAGSLRFGADASADDYPPPSPSRGGQSSVAALADDVGETPADDGDGDGDADAPEPPAPAPDAPDAPDPPAPALRQEEDKVSVQSPNNPQSKSKWERKAGGKAPKGDEPKKPSRSREFKDKDFSAGANAADVGRDGAGIAGKNIGNVVNALT